MNILGNIGTLLDEPATSEPDYSHRQPPSVSRENDEPVMKPAVSKLEAVEPPQHPETNHASGGTVLNAVSKFKAEVSSLTTEDISSSRRDMLKKQFGGVIQAILKVNASRKRRISEQIRLQRRELLSYTGSFGSTARGGPPTPLHELCSQHNVDLEELFECLHNNPHSIKIKDAKGR